MNDYNGYPWKTGDTLTAADLNSAIANAGGGGGGGGGAGIIRLMDQLVGVQRPDGVDCSAAMAACMAVAASNAAAGLTSVIELPVGTIDLSSAAFHAGAASTQYAYLVPDNTKIVGQGMDRTNIIWSQNNLSSYNLFGSLNYGSPTRGQNIEFADFTVIGGWTPTTMNVGGGISFLIYDVDNLRFSRVGNRFMRALNICPRGCRNVLIEGCDTAYGCVGGINFSGCTEVICVGNTFRFLGDDAISAHSNSTDDPDYVRSSIVIANNRFYNCLGVSAGGARNITITGNVFELCSTHAINLWTGTGTEGLSAMECVTVVGNTIRNMWNEANIANSVRPTGGSVAITVTENTARKGPLGAIPGENWPASAGGPSPGAVISRQTYFRSNTADSLVAVAGTRGITIADNVIDCTLPPSDGSATAIGGTGSLTGGTIDRTNKTYSKFSDYGISGDPVAQNRLWVRTFNVSMQQQCGWLDPSLPPPPDPGTHYAFRPNGISLGGNGPMRMVDVRGNNINHVASGVNITANWFIGLRITGNRISDCVASDPAAVVVNPPAPLGPCSVEIDNNVIDVDPDHLSPSRTGNGQWIQNPVNHAILLQSGGTLVTAYIHDNTVRNVGNVLQNNTGAQVQSWGNYQEYNPATGATLSFNSGIQHPGGSGWTTRQIDADPASATYGKMLGLSVLDSAAMPATGYYKLGSVVRNSQPVVDADNNILAGWVKVAQSGTAGGVFSPTYAPDIGRDFAALTELGASNGVVAAIELAAAGSLRFENDGTAGWPTATLSAPPAGGTAGTLAIATQATVSPVFPTGTVDLSSTYTFGNGTTVPLIANGGTGLAAGQTLTELSGHSPTPHKVVVNTVSSGVATNISWSDGVSNTGYGYTSYPPSPANFTGGLRLYLPLFTVLAGSSISIVSGGYYASTRPTVSFAPAPYQNTASPTVKMGASWYADAAGAHGAFDGTSTYTATGATTPRTAQDHAGDRRTVRDFGAYLNGTLSDAAGIGAHLAALGTNEPLVMPPGAASLVWGSVQNTTPTFPVLFKTEGVMSGGSAMVQAFNRVGKGDLFESYSNGTKMLVIRSGKADAGGVLRIEHNQVLGGGTGGFVNNVLNIVCQDNTAAVTSMWGINVSMDSYSNQAGWPQNVAGSFSLHKHGTAWASAVHITADDQQNLPSSTSGAHIGLEMGYAANNVDDAFSANVTGGTGVRMGLHLSLKEYGGTSPVLPGEISFGILADGTANSIVKSVFATSVNMRSFQVFDARGSQAPSGYASPAAAVRMSAGQIVDFNGGTALNSAAGAYLQYRTATGRLYYVIAGVDQWSVDASGNVRARGTITGSTTP